VKLGVALCDRESIHELACCTPLNFKVVELAHERQQGIEVAMFRNDDRKVRRGCGKAFLGLFKIAATIIVSICTAAAAATAALLSFHPSQHRVTSTSCVGDVRHCWVP
jgi:hypothetical protein